MGAFRGSCHRHSAGALLLALAFAVDAQDPEPTPEQRAADEASTALPEMMVTSQKITQTLESVPASVSALSGDTIRETGTSGYAELQDYTANVSIRLSSGAGQYSIRGFGTPDTNPAFDPSVGTVIDGVYYARSNYLAAFYEDVDRFEVLRGPQGTLFGKNNTAGIFNVVTAAPEEHSLVRWELLGGSDGDRSFRPVLNVPLGGGFAMRVAGNYSHGDRGTLHNTYLDRGERNVDQDTTRVRLRYAADDDLTVDVGLLYSHMTQNFNQFQSSLLTAPMLALFQSYDPEEDAVVDLKNSASHHSLEEGVIRSLSVTFDQDLGHAWGANKLRLTSITAAASISNPRFDLDADFSAVPFISDSMVIPRTSRQFSEELHLSGEVPSLLGWGRGVTFVFGGYYFQSRFKTSDLFNIEDLGAAFAYEVAAQSGAGGAPGPFGTIGGTLGGPLQEILLLLNPVTGGAGLGTEQNASVKLDQQARDYALFGQAEHRIADEWYLIGGLRFDIESKSGDASSKANGRLIPLIARQQDHQTHIERIEHQLSPKGGFKWAPSKHVEAYGTWSRGFKSGGFNALPLTPDNIEYEPERATSIELGGKVRVLAGALRFSGAVFTTDFENLQVSTFQNNSFVVENAAEARSRGFEIDLHWLTPLRGLSFYTSVGLADAKYTKYDCAPAPSDSEAPPPPQCPQPSGGPGEVISPTPPTQDLAGKPLSFAPKWTATLIPSYNLRLPRYMEAIFAVDILYRGKQYLNPDNDERKAQAGQTLFNARIGLGDLTKNWKLMLVGHNLTDRIVLDQAIDQPLAPGNIAVVRGDHGRYYTANLAVTF